MANGKPRLYGTIGKAYCYELHAELDAYEAASRGVADGNHHFFCPTEGCGWDLLPAVWQRETPKHIKAWFATAAVPPPPDLSHEAGCPYRDEQHIPNGNGGERPNEAKDPDKPALPFIPGEILVGLRQPRPWPVTGLNRAAIVQQMRNAGGRGADGTIEDVMDAHLFLCNRWDEYKRLEGNGEILDKSEYSKLRRIDINGTISNYVRGFCKLENEVGNVGQANHWRTHVFHGSVIVRRSRVGGNYLLYPAGKKFIISIDRKAAQGLKGKEYLPELLEKAAAASAKGKASPVLVYFWDIQPLGQNPEGRFPIEILTPDRILQTALREEASSHRVESI